MRRRLGAILTLVGIGSFVVASLLGGVSLGLEALGYPTAQVAVAGAAELLTSVLFLVCGVGIFRAARSVCGDRSEPPLKRVIVATAAVLAGICWTIGGVRGILHPLLLRAALGVE